MGLRLAGPRRAPDHFRLAGQARLIALVLTGISVHNQELAVRRFSVRQVRRWVVKVGPQGLRAAGTPAMAATRSLAAKASRFCSRSATRGRLLYRKLPTTPAWA